MSEVLHVIWFTYDRPVENHIIAAHNHNPQTLQMGVPAVNPHAAQNIEVGVPAVNQQPAKLWPRAEGMLDHMYAAH